ncbi:MAG: hypothetical protein DMD49_04665 [Gemmatimonadetes bacterium]|nr:MAG: hypothetical protein DMD49_04665 [Gemmatimonadota bacterium]
MKVILPLAGKGTRLLPLTKRVPKPLVRVAGRPVMDYVMETLGGLDLDELIVITGHLKDVVEKYVVERYRVNARFVEQKTLDGTAGAVNLARPYVDGPVLIVFVDTLIEADLSLIRTSKADGVIWAKEVDDYRRFGVIVTDPEGYMTRIVEKPDPRLACAVRRDRRGHAAASGQRRRVLSHGRVPIHGGSGAQAARGGSDGLV